MVDRAIKIEFAAFNPTHHSDMQDMTQRVLLNSPYNLMSLVFSTGYTKIDDRHVRPFDDDENRHTRQIRLTTDRTTVDRPDTLPDAVAFGVTLSQQLENARLVIQHDDALFTIDKTDIAAIENKATLGMLQDKIVQQHMLSQREAALGNPAPL